VKVYRSNYSVLTRKAGAGIARRESELPIPNDAAAFLIASSSLRIDKQRLVIDGW